MTSLLILLPGYLQKELPILLISLTIYIHLFTNSLFISGFSGIMSRSDALQFDHGPAILTHSHRGVTNMICTFYRDS